ncbi:MAG: aminotransferase class IV [Reyranellaceae bacterium]
MLPGVSRQMTMDMATQLGIACTPGAIDLFDAADAAEMFLTSTSLCILPVKSFNGTPVANDKTPGPITRKLIDAYAESVGCDFVARYLKFLQ